MVPVRFFRDLNRTGGHFPSRKEIAEKRYLSPADQAAALGRRGIYALSCSWLQTHYPDDANNFRLDDITHKLDKLEADDDDLVYFDYLSIPSRADDRDT